jgi:hypothetical protein
LCVNHLGYFSRGKGCAIGSGDPFFLTISQQKPGKLIFREKMAAPPPQSSPQ